MPRKNLYFTDEQVEKLARLHEITGVSMSEICRIAIKAYYNEVRDKNPAPFLVAETDGTERGDSL